MNETNFKYIKKKKTVLRWLLAISIIISINILLFFSFNTYDLGPKYSLSVSEDLTSYWLLIIFILTLIVLLTSILIVLSYKRFWEYISYKYPSKRGCHTLSIDDLFENENRKNIIKAILEEPGIHNNELLRQCNLQKGQLQWHLQLLIHYNIIKKEKIGYYSAYFPSMHKKDKNENRKLLISKSKTNFRILNIIEDNPGINPSKIASNLNLNKSSVKYHVDRLIEENMVNSIKDGRIIKLHINKE